MRPSLTIAAATLADVDQVFAEFEATDPAPGIVYGVVVDGALVHSGAAGRAAAVAMSDTADDEIEDTGLSADSVLRIASMTKSFTAATILLLRDEGVLRLDDPVSSLVPELAHMVLPTTDAPPPTVRMLLTMSGGLPTDDPWADRQESMVPEELSDLLASGLTFVGAPGTMFEYSNLGYVILGRIIANVTGRRYHDVVRTRLLEPLGMTSTGFARSDVHSSTVVDGHFKDGEAWVVEPFAAPGEFSPLGGIFSSVRDLATWVGGFTDAFPARDDPPGLHGSHPLSRASRREMQQLQRFNDVSVPAARAGAAADVRARVVGYGFGLAVAHDTRWGHVVAHSGGYPGYGSHMRWHPTTGIGVIALANGRYAPASRPATAALEVVLSAIRAPSGRTVRWSPTREMQRAVQRLVTEWDDDLADSIFSANVDLDLARDARRAEITEIAERLGAIVANENPDVSSDSAADAAWWIVGSAGRAFVEIQLTPHRQPLVQTLDVRFVGPLSTALLAALRSAIEELGGSNDSLTEPECTDWTHADAATFRARVGVDQWKIALDVDPESGEIVSSVSTPEPPSVHRFDVSVDADQGR